MSIPEPGERQRLYDMFQRRPYATWTILGICALMLVIMDRHHLLSMPTAETAIAYGAQENGALWAHHEYWRLLSAAFVHFGPLHLLANGYALYILGTFQERFFGPGRFLFVYLGAGLAGNLATLWLLPAGNPSAGASGAVFGLLGAQLMLEVQGTLPVPLRRPLWKGVLPWIILNLGLGFGVNHFADATDISLNNYAHIGGLLGGAGLCALLRFPAVTRPAAVVGYLLAVASLLCCGLAVYQGITTDPEFILFGR